MTLLIGCAEPVGNCRTLPLLDYTDAQRGRLADEIERTSPDSMTRVAMADYVQLRAMVRACKGE